MTTRYQISLVSLAVACACVFAPANTASALELFDQLFGKGASTYGCDAPECHGHVSKAGGKAASGCHTCDCSASTPLLDRVTGFTRSVKCRLQSIQLPRINLSNLFPCYRCGSSCGCCDSCAGGKGGGKTMMSPTVVSPYSGYDSSSEPVNAPPIPVVNGEI